MKKTFVAICIIAALVACTVDAKKISGKNNVNVKKSITLAKEAGCSKKKIQKIRKKIRELKEDIEDKGVYEVGQVECPPGTKAVTDCNCNTMTILATPRKTKAIKPAIDHDYNANQEYIIVIQVNNVVAKVNCEYGIVTKDYHEMPLTCPAPKKKKRSALKKKQKKNQRLGRMARWARRRLLQQGGCST